MKSSDKVKRAFNDMTGKRYFDIGNHGSVEQVAEVFRNLMQAELNKPDPAQHDSHPAARRAAFKKWEDNCRKAREAACHCIPGLHLALREGRCENMKTACKHARGEDLERLLEGLEPHQRMMATSRMTLIEINETYEQLRSARPSRPPVAKGGSLYQHAFAS